MGGVDHPAGPSKLIYPTTEEIARLMQGMAVPPDFDYVTQSSERNLRYIHKRIGRHGSFISSRTKSRNPRKPCAASAFRASAPSCVAGQRPDGTPGGL